jgi:protein-tyrosine phosphatase
VVSNNRSLHVSFVCTGNICRSPVAALVFAEHVRRAGLAGQVEVSSAGTGPWHVGEPADPRAARSLLDAGYSTAHVAAQVSREHLDADLLVALDSGHARDLRRLAGDPDRVRLLRSFDPDADGTDVPDPYYGGREGFDEVLAMVEAAVPGLLAWARERL